MYWIFVCGRGTERECFLRRLFGDHESYMGERQVRRGDTLFLHNRDTDVLYGPFEAITDACLGIEPDAWGGRFNWQVRVKWNELYKLDNASRRFHLHGRLSVSDNEGEEIIRTLREEGIKLITPPPLPEDILNKIRQLDEEIHSLAHEIEECRMTQGRHPADREIDLDALKAKFCAKMRDFVWAVRQLDELTGIMGLPSSKKGR